MVSRYRHDLPGFSKAINVPAMGVHRPGIRRIRIPLEPQTLIVCGNWRVVPQHRTRARYQRGAGNQAHEKQTGARPTAGEMWNIGGAIRILLIVTSL